MLGFSQGVPQCVLQVRIPFDRPVQIGRGRLPFFHLEVDLPADTVVLGVPRFQSEGFVQVVDRLLEVIKSCLGLAAASESMYLR